MSWTNFRQQRPVMPQDCLWAWKYPGDKRWTKGFGYWCNTSEGHMVRTSGGNFCKGMALLKIDLHWHPLPRDPSECSKQRKKLIVYGKVKTKSHQVPQKHLAPHR